MKAKKNRTPKNVTHRLVVTEVATKRARRRAPKPRKGEQLELVATTKSAVETIATLCKSGWNQTSLAKQLGTSPGRVWFWAHGKPCNRLAELQQLVFLSPPRKDVVTLPSKGGLNLRRALSPKRVRLGDSRQLLLDLRSAIDAFLVATK